MSEVILMIEPKDVIERTLLDGNIDNDNINPIIFIAQSTYLKSFLGLKLYTKIYNDFVADTLSGEYLIIFEEYLKDILAFQTAVLYVDFSSYKISQNGIHKVSGENMQLLDDSETQSLVLRYSKLVANVEANFKEYISDKNIAELNCSQISVDNDFPWH